MTLFLISLLIGVAPPTLPPGVEVEAAVDPAACKIVFVAGSNFYKPGEHAYLEGCGVLMAMVKKSPGVVPVLALDWPKKPETFRGAKAVVFFCDGGDKHPVLKATHAAELQKLMDAGVGLVQLHQVADVPADFADRARGWAGGAWEKKSGQRAHWVETFQAFPDHAVMSGVEPFTIDDGYLWNIRFVPKLAGVTPLLRTVNPKSSDDKSANGAIVSWAYQRPGGGRSVTFTGGHLQQSFDEIGYRRFLTNAILWTAGRELPPGGADVGR